MRLGVFSPILKSLSLEDALKYLKEQGVDDLELGVGGYPGTAHADAKILCKDEAKRKELINLFKKYGIGISALSVHGNCVHPDKEKAKAFEEDFKATCILAGQLGINTIITFSGCPGSDKDAKQPSWVTCAWPPEFREVGDYQWNEVLIPYWKEAVKFANANGVTKIALEMHPGFCVYNPETLLRLREAVGETIGANLDPSHLYWQGMDIVEVIKYLEGAIYHFHAKDTYLDIGNIKKNGVLCSKKYSKLSVRPWFFGTLGCGHDETEWKQIIIALKTIGYDGVISIEHEDALMSPKEGLGKAIEFLKRVIIKEQAGDSWWA